MAKKQTYEELEQLVEELKEKALQNEQTKAVRESEERYRRITEAVTDYVFSVRIKNGHPADTVHGANCVAVTGYTSEDFNFDPYLWIRMVHGEDQALVQEQAQCVFSGQNLHPIEHRILRKDGVVRWVRNTLVPHYDLQGNLLSYDGIVRDITERKRAEEALLQERNKLQDALAKVKILSGLIPICCSCKNIRDDKGYWKQIEGYIQDHSDAAFSHGICPECAKKLYPDFDLYP